MSQRVLLTIVSHLDSVRSESVLFDRYDELSLKSKTRVDRTSGMQIQCKIENDINIESITSEKFLSHFNTKRNLKKHLSCKVLSLLKYSLLKHYSSIVSCCKTICCCLQQYYWMKHYQFSRRIEVLFTWGSWHFDCTTFDWYCQKKSILSVRCSMLRHRRTPLAFVLLPTDM